jgi:hypothetical protein
MTLFLSDGTNVVGPLTPAETVKYIDVQKIDLEKWQVCDQTHIWKILKNEFPKIAALAVELQANPPVNGGGSHRPANEGIVGKKDILDPVGALEKIAEVRVLFNSLWEKQNERLVAKIKNCQPDEKALLSAKELGLLKEKIASTVIDFWRKEGTILNWIKEITWGDPTELSDSFVKLQSTNVDEKMAQVEKHLNDRRIYDWEGCYCFMSGEKYLYIGETKHSLGRRMLIEHKNKIFWHEADSIRLLIPGDKRNTKKLERLLILNYMPTVNDNDGVQSSSADEVLEILETEIDELARP